MFFFLLLLLLAFPHQVRAETVSLTMLGDTFDQESNLQVQVATSVSQPDISNLKVRPRIDPPQTLFVYAGDKIFSLGSFWTDIPALPGDLTLHAPVPFQTADLWFEVLDTQTGQTYETPKKQVFSFGFAQSYIEDLNRRMYLE